MFRRVIASVVLGLLVAAGAGAARAQNGAEDKREKIREKVRVLVMTQLIEKLDLDEKTAMKLKPIIERSLDDAAAIAKDSGALRRELRRLLRSGNAKDAEINKLIDRLVENRAKVHKVETDLMTEARKVLKPAQAARFVVVLPRMRARIENAIRRAAESRKGAPADSRDDAEMEDDEEF
jgi:Spy/CpxP family protein refolding chaperone